MRYVPLAWSLSFAPTASCLVPPGPLITRAASSRLTSVTAPCRTTDFVYLPPTWNQWQPGSRMATTSCELPAVAGTASPRAAIAVTRSLRIVGTSSRCVAETPLITPRREQPGVRESSDFAFGELPNRRPLERAQPGTVRSQGVPMPRCLVRGQRVHPRGRLHRSVGDADCMQ